MSAASRVQTPPGPWQTVLDFLCDRFPAIPRSQWQDRMQRGRVTLGDGHPLAGDTPYRPGLELRYYREVAAETPIPGTIFEIHRDAHLLVVDKPPFLPVTPSGPFVEQTLLAQLRHRYGLHDLAPLHRIDRLTSGLVMLSHDPATRGRYQRLFAERGIEKVYHAIAPALPEDAVPAERASRIVEGEPFFRMREAEGTPNSLTRIACLDRAGPLAHYALRPVSGRKHQLRVHLAALGAPILHDPLYPDLQDPSADDFSRPLMLLAQALSFTDPLTGQPRAWQARRRLELAPDASALLREDPDRG